MEHNLGSVILGAVHVYGRRLLNATGIAGSTECHLVHDLSWQCTVHRPPPPVGKAPLVVFELL